MSNITGAYAPLKSNELRDEYLPPMLKIMYEACSFKQRHEIYQRPLRVIFGDFESDELASAISAAGFKQGYMKLTSLGANIEEALVGNQRGWQAIGRRTRDLVYRHEYKLMLKNDVLIRDVVHFNQLLTRQNLSFPIIDDLLGLSTTWLLSPYFVRIGFRGQLGHREKLLSLLHDGPTSLWVVISNRIENLAHHIVQLQALGYGITTSFGVNGQTMFELTKVPVTYVELDTDDRAYWEQWV
jgi:hypothetical protein